MSGSLSSLHKAVAAPGEDLTLSLSDVRSIFGVLLRRWKLIVVVPLIAVLAAYGALKLIPPLYKSTRRDPRRRPQTADQRGRRSAAFDARCRYRGDGKRGRSAVVEGGGAAGRKTTHARQGPGIPADQPVGCGVRQAWAAARRRLARRRAGDGWRCRAGEPRARSCGRGATPPPPQRRTGAIFLCACGFRHLGRSGQGAAPDRGGREGLSRRSARGPIRGHATRHQLAGRPLGRSARPRHRDRNQDREAEGRERPQRHRVGRQRQPAADERPQQPAGPGARRRRADARATTRPGISSPAAATSRPFPKSSPRR